MYKNLTILLLVLISICACSEDKFEKPNEWVDRFFEEEAPAGLSVSVGHNGQIIWSRGKGFSDLEQGVQVTPSKTKFRIASIAKPFTAYALVRLYEEGKIDLDADIREYVPSFPQKEYPITVGQVSAHLAGIRHYRGDEPFRNEYRSIKDGLSIFQDDPLEFKPGEQWLYSSYGYNLLGVALEGASGKSFIQYMEEDVFLPMGMTDTVPDNLDKIIPNRGRYYSKQGGKYLNESEVDNFYKLPSGGFLGTTDDLVRFGMAHLSDDYLKESSKTLLWTRQKTSTGELVDYGIGWRIVNDSEGREWIGHGGGTIGGTSQLWLFPEDDLVISAASNLTDLNYRLLMVDLRNHFVEYVKVTNPENAE